MPGGVAARSPTSPTHAIPPTTRARTCHVSVLARKLGLYRVRVGSHRLKVGSHGVWVGSHGAYDINDGLGDLQLLLAEALAKPPREDQHTSELWDRCRLAHRTTTTTTRSSSSSVCTFS